MHVSEVSKTAKLAGFRAAHRTARVLPADFAARSDIDLTDALAAFRPMDRRPSCSLLAYPESDLALG